MLRGGVGLRTIGRHFGPEIRRGGIRASLKIAETLYEKAVVDKDVTALIWWTKTQMGWSAAKDSPKDRHPDGDQRQAGVEKVEV